MVRLFAAVAAIAVLNSAAVRAGAQTVPQDQQAAKQELLEEKLAEMNRLQVEIDQLRAEIGVAQQILVKVQALEISRTKMRQLGIEWSSVFEGGKDNAPSATRVEVPYRHPEFDFGVIDRTNTAQSFIESLEKNRVARVLAEPSLVVLSGRPATFEVGSEMPLPAAASSAKPAQFQSFGTRIDLMALALANQKIRLQLRVRLTEPDDAESVQLTGHQVPATSVRQVDTALELKSGQSAFLTGFIQKRVEAIQRESGVEATECEVETLLVVTPELVSAIASTPTKTK
jgi:pilus assembly protein CpaC